jgi:hypothetical protein
MALFTKKTITCHYRNKVKWSPNQKLKSELVLTGAGFAQASRAVGRRHVAVLRQGHDYHLDLPKQYDNYNMSSRTIHDFNKRAWLI